MPLPAGSSDWLHPGTDSTGKSSEPRCPECGEAVAASLPGARTGIPWQHHWTPHTFLQTSAMLLSQPRRAFRRLRLEDAPVAGRLFLVINLGLVGCIAAGFGGWGHGLDGLSAWVWGVLSAKLGLLLTYVEALGVTFFSRRRGWRVPWSSAERVAAYASVGWIITALLLGTASLTLTPLLDLAYGRIWDQHTPEAFALLGGLVFFAATALSFELLVWIGVRQVRFGNRRPSSRESSESAGSSLLPDTTRPAGSCDTAPAPPCPTMATTDKQG